MDTRTLAYFAFDELGTSVWKAIGVDGDADAAFTRLVAEGDHSKAELKRKFQSIIKELEKTHIIQLEPKEGS